MTEIEAAEKILEQDNCDGVGCSDCGAMVCMDGDFTAEELEAIVEADESVFSETKTMIEGIARDAQCSVGSLAGLSQSIDFALALREKES